MLLGKCPNRFVCTMKIPTVGINRFVYCSLALTMKAEWGLSMAEARGWMMKAEWGLNDASSPSGGGRHWLAGSSFLMPSAMARQRTEVGGGIPRRRRVLRQQPRRPKPALAVAGSRPFFLMTASELN